MKFINRNTVLAIAAVVVATISGAIAADYVPGVTDSPYIQKPQTIYGLPILHPGETYSCVKSMKPIDLSVVSPDGIKTNFRIPLGYLHEQTNFKGGEQETVFVGVLSDSLKPICLSNEYDLYPRNSVSDKFLTIYLRGANPKPDKAGDFFHLTKEEYKIFIKNDEYGNKIYWHSLQIDPKNQIYELTEFPKNYFKRPTLVRCVRMFNDKRLSCTVMELVTPKIMMEYTLYRSQLSLLQNLNKLDEDIYKLIHGFIAEDNMQKDKP